MIVPSEISVGMEQACAISIECWRLKRKLESLAASEQAGLRHIVRRLTDTLEGMGLRTLDLEGRPYDPGMMLDVIEIRDDCTVPEGCSMIAETVSPSVMWNGQLVKAGHVVVKRSSPISQDRNEAGE